MTNKVIDDSTWFYWLVDVFAFSYMQGGRWW